MDLYWNFFIFERLHKLCHYVFIIRFYEEFSNLFVCQQCCYCFCSHICISKFTYWRSRYYYPQQQGLGIFRKLVKPPTIFWISCWSQSNALEVINLHREIINRVYWFSKIKGSSDKPSFSNDYWFTDIFNISTACCYTLSIHWWVWGLKKVVMSYGWIWELMIEIRQVGKKGQSM